MKTERVRDWMGAPLVGCPVDVEMADVARLLWDEGIRHAPLLRKNGRVAGVLAARTSWVLRDRRDRRGRVA